jgi:hypothetical protein
MMGNKKLSFNFKWISMSNFSYRLLVDSICFFYVTLLMQQLRG